MSNHKFTQDEKLKQFIDEINRYEDIKLTEMPEYKLYISQIEEFFDKKLGKGMGDEEERKIISKTMIQNYIKDGLLMPPEGKSYNRNHVILLILIYNLKSILAIKDIKKLLLPILMEVDNEDNPSKVEGLYGSYLDLKNKILSEYTDTLKDDMASMEQYLEGRELVDELDKSPLILLVLTLIAQANAQKKLAEHIIDAYFTQEDES